MPKGRITKFLITWVVWPTHGSDWPPTIFFDLRSPLWAGSPTLGPILVLTSKICVTARRGLAWIFSYILVKTLMGNFQFQSWTAMFWRGHRCKKNSGLFAYAIAKSTTGWPRPFFGERNAYISFNFEVTQKSLNMGRFENYTFHLN